MVNHNELCTSFEKQFNIMRNQLAMREYSNLMKSAELFNMYLKTRLGEIEEKDGE